MEIFQTWVVHVDHVHEGSRGCGTVLGPACPHHACDVVKVSENGRIWSCQYSGDCCQGSLHNDSNWKKTEWSFSLASFFIFFCISSKPIHILLMLTFLHLSKVFYLSEAAVQLPKRWETAQWGDRGVTLAAAGFSLRLRMDVIMVAVQVVVTRRAEQRARWGQGASCHSSAVGVRGSLPERHWEEKRQTWRKK